MERRTQRSLLGAVVAVAVATAATACGEPGSDDGLARADSLFTAAAPVARTALGAVEGTREEGLAVFRGIPFAAPPVGELRWRPPAPATAWSDLRPASDFAPACYQASGPAAGGVAEAESSEDCLYLNVWSPAASTADALPVMVWIYGGGFTAGATSTRLYSGEQLARRGVVVVSVAYRVGPFGYLAHPALSAESEAHVSGNYGLLDQMAGLRWVRDNIAAFGGDPENVTVFGESAGGIAISMLAASPLAAGLFDKAISESGGSFGAPHSPPLPGENVQALREAERAGVRLAEAMGAADLAAMRAASAAQVQSASRGVEGVGWPVMDGHVIPDDQYDLYEAGRYNDTPVLIGFNSDEGALFGGPVTAAAYRESVRGRYGRFADEILAAFPAASATEGTQASRDLATDVMFGWHTVSWARLQTRTGSAPVYLYYFDLKPPYPEGNRLASARGAPHAAELPYVFGHLDQNRANAWRPRDREVSEMMMGFWTNFAKTGDPNGGELPEWRAFADADPPEAMIFSLERAPHMGPLPDPEHFEVLDRYMAWRRTQTGPVPTVEGPITEAGRGQPFGGFGQAGAPPGYVEQEWFLSGTATAYTKANEWRGDGAWEVEPADRGDYVVRMLVRRPESPSAFNGIVVVEWLNVSARAEGGADYQQMADELVRRGYAWVGVGAQAVGVHAPVTGLKAWDPERYEPLHHPGDRFSYDIFSQAARAVHASREEGGPMGGLAVERVLATGRSQSAFRLVTYVNAFHLRDRVFDGYFIHSRGRQAAGLRAEAMEGDEPDAVPAGAHVRADLDVPVLDLVTEGDMVTLGAHTTRQAAGATYRRWELAGAAHAEVPRWVVDGSAELDRGPGCAEPVNSAPHDAVVKAGLRALTDWVTRGVAPPQSPEILLGDPSAADPIRRDDHGNALGGIRLPELEAPTATLDGLQNSVAAGGPGGLNFCFLFGNTRPFDSATLAALYPDHTSFVDRFVAAVDGLERGGYLLAPEADAARRAARDSGIRR